MLTEVCVLQFRVSMKPVGVLCEGTVAEEEEGGEVSQTLNSCWLGTYKSRPLGAMAVTELTSPILLDFPATL